MATHCPAAAASAFTVQLVPLPSCSTGNILTNIFSDVADVTSAGERIRVVSYGDPRGSVKGQARCRSHGGDLLIWHSLHLLCWGERQFWTEPAPPSTTTVVKMVKSVSSRTMTAAQDRETVNLARCGQAGIVAMAQSAKKSLLWGTLYETRWWT